jgi:hypothetical protein
MSENFTARDGLWASGNSFRRIPSLLFNPLFFKGVLENPRVTGMSADPRNAVALSANLSGKFTGGGASDPG